MMSDKVKTIFALTSWTILLWVGYDIVDRSGWKMLFVIFGGITAFNIVFWTAIAWIDGSLKWRGNR